MAKKSKGAAGPGAGLSVATKIAPKAVREAGPHAAPQISAKIDPHAKLHIVVCIKPVPDPARWEKLALDPETMLLNRSQVPAVINPLDLNAIEQALVIKESIEGTRTKTVGVTAGRRGNGITRAAPRVTISVLTMAPPAAEEQLREALAMGCDRAYLASDRAFAGADTLATARCLAAAIKKIGAIGKNGEIGDGKNGGARSGGVDLIFCGGYSADGSTAQVGPQVAELLGMPDLTHVVSLEIVKGSAEGTRDGPGPTTGGPGATAILRAGCKVEEGTLLAECDLPALVTFDREANRPRLPSMSGIRRARELQIVSWSAADLGLDPSLVGLKGSPTQMLNVFTQAQGRKGETLSGSAAEMTGTLIEKLRADKAIEDV
ncbi:MAG: electron transfer flavoprotein subunit beta/FixA family protein [Candidatus Eisenbacteria bacterium]